MAELNTFLLTGDDIRTFTTVPHLAQLNPEILEKIRSAGAALRTPYTIDKTKYDNVYVTSDLHGDVLKFDNMLHNLGIVNASSEPGKLASLYNKIPLIEWLPKKTLVILVGDIVDAKRKMHGGLISAVPDPTGNIELLLHSYLYNLRLKARQNESELLFTVGNHDYLTVIQKDNAENSHFYESYVHQNADTFFGSRANRRNCLLPFYNCCPYVMLDLGGEIAFVHGGFLGYDQYRSILVNNTKDLKDLQENLDFANDFSILNDEEHSFLSNVGDDIGTGYEFSPLWSRAYAHLPAQEVCPTIKEYYKMVVVGHCQMASDCGYNGQHSAHILAKKSYRDFNCGGKNGCVVIGCGSEHGPQIALVDIAFSRAFSGFFQGFMSSKQEFDRRAEVLHLKHNKSVSSTERYYNVIIRRNAGSPTTKEMDTVVVWKALSEKSYKEIAKIKSMLRYNTLNYIRSPEFGWNYDNYETYTGNLLDEIVQHIEGPDAFQSVHEKIEAKNIIKKYIKKDLYLDAAGLNNENVPTPLHFIPIDKDVTALNNILTMSDIPIEWFFKPLPPKSDPSWSTLNIFYERDNLNKYAGLNFIDILNKLLDSEKNTEQLFTIKQIFVEFLLESTFNDKNEILSNILEFKNPKAPTLLHYAVLKGRNELISGIAALKPPLNWMDCVLPNFMAAAFYDKYSWLVSVKFANKSARGILDLLIKEETDISKLAVYNRQKALLLQTGAKPKTRRTLKKLFQRSLAKSENEPLISNNWRRTLSLPKRQGGLRKTVKGGANSSGNISSKYTFRIVLFSKKTVPEKIKEDVKNIITSLFGETTMTSSDESYEFFGFLGLTGINPKLEKKRTETVYTVLKAPAVLYTNLNVHVDTRLTRLEGLIGKALLQSGIDVSLIAVPHGIRPENNSKNLFYTIGLCYPRCTDYKMNFFNDYIQS